MNDDVRRAVEDKLLVAQDNLHRTKAAWAGLGTKTMNDVYSESGKTRQDILSVYEREVERWTKALASVKAA